MRKIHLYLAFPFGIVISLVCLSGALLTFEKELTQFTHPERSQLAHYEGSPLSLDTLVTRVQATLPNSVHITSVAIPSNASQAWQFSLSKPRKASLMVNPYTGEVLSDGGRTPFFATMFRLHRWLLGPSKSDDGSIGWGRLIVGISTLLFVFVLISGIVIWWPRTKKVLRNSLKWPFHRGFRPFMRGAHVALGVYAAILLLAMALTGLTWSFTWYKDGFYALFGAGKQTATAHNNGKNADKKGGHVKKERQHPSSIAWQAALETVRTVCPEYERITIAPGSVSVKTTNYGNSRASDKYTIEAPTGRIVSIERYADTPLSQNIRGWVYSVHTGSFGGLFTRILWCVASLIGATLPLSGYYLWWKRIRRKR